MVTRCQIVDKTIMEADLDHDGKISFEEFTKMVENTDVSNSMTVGKVFFACVANSADIE
jgi:serine/threonine-protein phosphatase 2B regulatory subunit